ncbi:SDR family NAD(P)-dependent oxidoreductase, partial [Candidatus Aerophobetes bacterium]|nr:SDR family NAD(P)-dependent oxidoreductase [Candidatus Aerophobetes bacterium]
GRVANRLNLGGSNFTVDAACASSLAGLEVGIKQLQAGDCDVALVGAVDGTTHAFAYLAFSKTYALSPRGHARPFDDSADGTVISEGAAVLILKRLDDAKRDGDDIYAVIKGIGSSSDGRNRSLVAPHPGGEISALKRAYQDANIDPVSVELIEAHGTGTAIGDKVEIDSLCQVFQNANSFSQRCAIGSAKSMIGHCKAAAGMAGLIKTALALKHKVLPPTIGVDKPNSLVDFKKTPFYINTQSRAWFKNRSAYPRRAGVSAFGFGGTNFHVILQEYTHDFGSSSHLNLNPRPAEIFSWARSSGTELEDTIKHLSSQLEKNELTDLAQLAYSVFVDEENNKAATSSEQSFQLSIVANSIQDLQEKLKVALKEIPLKNSFNKPQGIYYSEVSLNKDRDVCFLFPGQGSQRINMLQELVISNPRLYPIFELGDKLLKDFFEQSLSRYIYPPAVFSEVEREKQQVKVSETQIAQPALALIDLFAHNLLKTYGIEAKFMAGHSFGEYVALCAGGAFSQEELIFLSAIRGKLVQKVSKTNPGAMAAVHGDAEKVRIALEESGIPFSLANINSPNQVVIAGASSLLEQAVKVLNSKGFPVRKIPVNAAFHTPHMNEVSKKLAKELTKINFHKPQCKVYSNTTTNPYPDSSRNIQALLARHIKEPVQFEKQILKIYQAGARIFIEVGPGQVLTRLTKDILGSKSHVALSIDQKGSSSYLQFAHILCQMKSLGLAVNLKPWFDNRGLCSMSVDELLKKEKAYTNPGSLTWRINGGKARPWYSTSSSKSIQPSVNEHQKTLDNSLPIISQFQENMKEFLKIQQEQQKLTERIMALQEKIMNFYLNKDDGTSPEANIQEAKLPQKSSKRTILTGTVPPAPVLPQLPASDISPSLSKKEEFSSILADETKPAEMDEVQMPEPNPPVADTNSTTLEQIPSTEEFQKSLLQTVSERTGYPAEMLGIDLDLEADLGIDSIKLVEIISAMRRYHTLLQQDEEKIVDTFTQLKTLRNILDWYDGNRLKIEKTNAAPAAQNIASELVLPRPETSRAPEKIDSISTDPVQRYIPRLVSSSLGGPFNQNCFPGEHLILLIGEAPGLSATLHKVAVAERYHVRQIIPGERTKVLRNNCFEVNLSSLESIHELHSLISKSGDIVGGIFNLMGVVRATSNNNAYGENLEAVRDLFLLIKVFEADLKKSARSGGGLLVNFSGMGGGFGFEGNLSFPVGQAGCIGLCKSIAREWPEIKVKCIDVALDTAPEILSARIWQELTARDDDIEIGLTKKGRWKIELEKDTLEEKTFSSPPIDSQSLILITGGARGITAEVTLQLAAKYKPQLIIIGRTPFLHNESSETKKLHSPQLLRKYFTEKLQQKDARITPRMIEEYVQKILKERQVRSNLLRMEKAGARVHYFALDLCHEERFANFLKEIYRRWGKIDGVIHAAGVIEDKLIKDKSAESFSRVFFTKTCPAKVLAEKLQPETLKFLVFFSSVAARFGNVGQSDYAAANEVLNKLALRLDREWPARVVSINWGPWELGMVSEELRKVYSSRGINPIAVSEGVKFFMQELEQNTLHAPEVLISRSLKEIAQVFSGNLNI